MAMLPVPRISGMIENSLNFYFPFEIFENRHRQWVNLKKMNGNFVKFEVWFFLVKISNLSIAVEDE